jgi:hypothetical protein
MVYYFYASGRCVQQTTISKVDEIYLVYYYLNYIYEL